MMDNIGGTFEEDSWVGCGDKGKDIDYENNDV